jgi:gamma-glutamyltranspeptidase/glutathione hydrolase
LATQAALQVLQNGGNAVDAAVAAGLTLGVVDGHNSGIGGGCFLLMRLADGQVIAIDGRETAPAAATRDMYLRNGRVDPQLSRTGPLAIAVPGALAAYQHAAKNHGRKPMTESLASAADLAGAGFRINTDYAERLAAEAGDLAEFPATRAIFLDSAGSPLKSGQLLRQPELATTYRAIAREGIAWFYEGPFARATAKWMRENDGLLTMEDFKSYEAKERHAVRSRYRGHEILGFPPPSSGGVHVAQILNLLELLDVSSLGDESPQFIHLTAESMKLAFADRAHWLGDPDFTPIPRGLISKEYARELALRIDPDRAMKVPGHSLPPSAAGDVFGGHTTHISVADAEGNWVACTATINTTFGSKVVIPGTGVVMNNEMDDFSAQPGVANYFGLVGAEANSVEPGKRPLSSMAPTIVLKDGKPVLALGAAGGPTIISQTVLSILHVLDADRHPEAALGLPRFHHQWLPDVLRMEAGFPEGIVRSLTGKGHTVERVGTMGATQMVGWDSGTEAFTGAADPRRTGLAAGW